LNQGAIDVFIADSQQKQDDILYVRSMVYEALKFETIEILDVSLPPDQMATHISSVDNISAKYNVWLPTYGHAGDGNLHTHIMKITPGGDKITDWKNIFMEIRNEIIFDGIQKGGKISGEHGIGLIKKQYLEMCLGKTSIEIMKKIKQAFDPLYILNPGKIFDPD
ncbi:MAG TPA: FAD-linked oxidase C-terminal domain-containing protein, partial [bacterium]|nr:FAD-linked oxidase C-terminal domain-containing protein [bacterium]